MAKILSPSSKNKKNLLLISSFLLFQKMEFSGCNVKQFFIFFYISRNKSPEKRNKNPRKHIIQEVTFQAWKIKKLTLNNFFIFQEMWFYCQKLKQFLIFQEELPKPQKPKFSILLQKKLWINFSKSTLG